MARPGILSLLMTMALVLGQGGHADELTDGEIRRLIAELQSDSYAARQQATIQLQGLGPSSVALLAQAAVVDDTEVRARALAILMSQSLSSRADARQAVRQALGGLGQSSDHAIRTRAQATLARVQEAAATSAAAELTRLGAVLMPVPGGQPGTYNVQLGAKWKGKTDDLALLAELVDVPWLSLESAPVGDEALQLIARLGQSGRGPTKLFLGNSRLSGARLGALAPLKRLSYLSLKQLPVADAELAALPDFPELQYLGLDGTKIKGDGLKSLGRYPQLQVLWLDNTPITDQGLAHLRPLSNLRMLYLPGTRCSGPGLAALGELPALMSLSLKGVKLDPDSLKHLAHVEQLESLGLDQTNVNDEQLADLAPLGKLQILWLSSTAVGDAGLEHLRSLRSLRIVHLSDTQATPEGAEELQRSLPGCQVTMSSRLEPGGVRPIRRPPVQKAP
jgi:hypothetical protein